MTELILFFIGYFLYCWLQTRFFQSSNIELFYNKSETKMKNLVQQSQLHKARYVPYIWAVNKHFQSIFYLMLENIHQQFGQLNYERETFKMPDGGTIGFDYIIDQNGGKPQINDKRPLLVCLMGLAGGNQNLYSVSFIKKAQQNGYKPVVFLYRGAANMEITTSKLYCANCWRDFDFAIEYLQNKYPGKRIYAYGASLGALVLSNYLQNTQNTTLKGAVALSCPFDIKESQKYFKSFMYGLYNFLLGYNLNKNTKKCIESMKHQLKEEEYNYYIESLNQDYTLTHYDQSIIIKMFDYQSVDQYYEEVSLNQKFNKIQIPYFILNTRDDFLFKEDQQPFDEIRQSKNTVLGVTKNGGHVCFLEGSFFMKQWFVKPLIQFIDAVENNSQDQ